MQAMLVDCTARRGVDRAWGVARNRKRRVQGGGRVPDRVVEVPWAALADLPGAPETALDEEVTRALPTEGPSAPWECRLHGLLWLQRLRFGGSTAVLPPPLRAVGRLPVGGGAFIRYEDTPVGPYAEVLAGPLLRAGVRPVAHVPFIAVDAAASIRGGRVNWALPKASAVFSGDPATDALLSAEGPDWELRARSTARGPRIPMRAALRVRQVLPDGRTATFRATFRGRVQLARVHVEMSPGLSLGGWLRPGVHAAVRCVDTAARIEPLVLD
jgi:hypothetical protein